MKGPKSHTVTSNVSVPSFLQPFVNAASGAQGDAMSSLRSLLSPGTSLTTPMNDAQRQAIEMAMGVGRGEGGFIPTAQDALLKTARGDFLHGGPGFNEAVDASLRQAQPGILSRFGAGGRGHGGLAQAAIQRAASDAFAGLFNNERQRQLSAATALPGIATAGADILSRAGGALQAEDERQLAGPIAAQERLLSTATGALPAHSMFGKEQTQPVYNNPLAQILGIGSSLAGMFSGLGPLSSFGAGAGMGGFGSVGSMVGNNFFGSNSDPWAGLRFA